MCILNCINCTLELYLLFTFISSTSDRTFDETKNSIEGRHQENHIMHPSVYSLPCVEWFLLFFIYLFVKVRVVNCTLSYSINPDLLNESCTQNIITFYILLLMFHLL